MTVEIEGFDKTDLQNEFIFVDTEAQKTEDNEKKQVQELYLGWGVFWDRKKDKTSKCYFEKTSEFWDWVDLILEKKEQDIYLYAHNMDYDFKVLRSLDELRKRNYKLNFLAPCSNAFILIFEKPNQENNLVILSSTNYFKQSLKSIGDSLGYEKMEIDPLTAPKHRVKKYCLRDTKILMKIIKKFVKFLQKNRLGKLGYTAPSTAFNVYRKSFYQDGSFDNKNRVIKKHNIDEINKIELNSYRGGMCDLFTYGEVTQKLYKLDINSMYPFLYSSVQLPYKLSGFFTSKNHNQQIIKDKLNEVLYKEDKDVIAELKISLPKEHSYILKKLEKQHHPNSETTKAIRLSGKYQITLTSPEIKFVKQFGEISQIKTLCIYDSRDLLSSYCSFFYNNRLEARDKNNDVQEKLNKLLLNSIYGKFGQQEKTTEEVTNQEAYEVVTNIYENCKVDSDPKEFDNFTIIEESESYHFLKLKDKFFLEEKHKKPSRLSFIPIASLITAHSRNYLVNLFYLAGESNVFYCDTDSLFVNKQGYKNLKNGGLDVRDKLVRSDLIPSELIDNGEKELGKLELEGKSQKSSFYRPKFYDFDAKRKCKGIKLNQANKIKEDEVKAIYQQEQFRRFKSSLKENTLNKQVIKKNLVKKMNKKYEDGLIQEDNKIVPFNAQKDLIGV